MIYYGWIGADENADFGLERTWTLEEGSRDSGASVACSLPGLC